MLLPLQVTVHLPLYVPHDARSGLVAHTLLFARLHTTVLHHLFRIPHHLHGLPGWLPAVVAVTCYRGSAVVLHLLYVTVTARLPLLTFIHAVLPWFVAFAVTHTAVAHLYGYIRTIFTVGLRLHNLYVTVVAFGWFAGCVVPGFAVTTVLRYPLPAFTTHVLPRLHGYVTGSTPFAFTAPLPDYRLVRFCSYRLVYAFAGFYPAFFYRSTRLPTHAHLAVRCYGYLRFTVAGLVYLPACHVHSVYLSRRCVVTGWFTVTFTHALPFTFTFRTHTLYVLPRFHVTVAVARVWLPLRLLTVWLVTVVILRLYVLHTHVTVGSRLWFTHGYGFGCCYHFAFTHRSVGCTLRLRLYTTVYVVLPHMPVHPTLDYHRIAAFPLRLPPADHVLRGYGYRLRGYRLHGWLHLPRFYTHTITFTQLVTHTRSHFGCTAPFTATLHLTLPAVLLVPVRYTFYHGFALVTHGFYAPHTTLRTRTVYVLRLPFALPVGLRLLRLGSVLHYLAVPFCVPHTTHVCYICRTPVLRTYTVHDSIVHGWIADFLPPYSYWFCPAFVGCRLPFPTVRTYRSLQFTFPFSSS